MGAPIITDKAEVISWMRNGKTNVEVAQLLYDKYRVRISPDGLSMFRKRHNLPALRQVGTDLIPWRLQPEHRDLWPAKMLRAEAKSRRGEPLSPVQARSLASWKARLDRDDAVVHYDPQTREGFFYVPREPSDEDLVRQP